ncbi:MAG: iron-sulfur cluster biosynthesis family protein, partial [Limosilactobacillus mucosae]
MKLTFTPQAQQRLQKYLQPDSKLILDFDDGVGPFSKLGNCSLDANFKLIIVKKDAKLPDFNAQLASNLGPVWYKDYTAPQLDEKMEVRFNPTYFTMPLVSEQRTMT